MKYIKKYKQKFEAIKKLLNKDDPVIVEVGAHFGEDSLRFLEFFSDAAIYCFEPDPRCIKIFKKYVNSPRCTLIEKALSQERGVASFYQSYKPHHGPVPEKYDWISYEDYYENYLNSSGASSLKRGYDSVMSETINVETDTYDNFIEEYQLPEVDLLWIDVQGAEKDVLVGAQKNLKNVNNIIIEYGEDQYEDFLSLDATVYLLSLFGFEAILSHEGDVWLSRKKS